MNANPRLNINRSFHLAYFKFFQALRLKANGKEKSKLKDKNVLEECSLIKVYINPA